MLDHHAKLRVIAIIRPCIVIKRVDRAVTNRSNRTPEEVTKVDNQVRRNTMYLFVYLLRFVDLRPNIHAIVIHQRFELRDKFIAERLNLVGLDYALRFSPLDIEEDARVIPTIAPHLRPAPVDRAPFDSRQPLWLRS